MGVRRLTGMNSDAMSVETHSVSANTAPQDAERGVGATSAPVDGRVMSLSGGWLRFGREAPATRRALGPRVAH